MGRSERKWLVKSNNIVDGPFEFNEIVEDIFKGDVHLLDEIKGPFERWRPIRDHSLFAAAIEKLKATTYSRREVTITETVDLATRTMEITQTNTDTYDGDENTSTVTSNLTGSGVVSDMSLEKPAPPKSKNYNTIPMPPVKEKSRFPMVFMLTFLVIISGAVAVLLYDFKQTKQVEQNLSDFDKFTDQGLIHLKVGQYREALNFFNKAYKISPDDPNLILEMSPLMIQFDGQFGHVQVTVENLLATRYQKEFMKRGKNIVGMSLSYRGQYNEALDEINKSLNIDDQYYPSLVNKGFVLMKLGRPNEAILALQRAVQVSPKESMARYLLTRAYVQEGFRSKNKQFFSEAISTSNDYAQNFSDFKQEVLFLVAVAKMHLGVSQAELSQAVRTMMEVDPELTSLHVHNVDYDFQSFNWQDYFELCKSMSQNLDQTTSIMLIGLCQIKTGDNIGAKATLERVLSQSKTDGVLQGLYVSTLFQMNDVAQAKNTINFISGMDKVGAFVQVLARGCLLSSDMECAEQIMESPYFSKMSLLYSHWLNAEVHKTSDLQKTKNSVLQGLNISSSFSPLLKLRRQL